ncbi:uncharacterized protein (TIGR03083 family) [Labedella gwakjiensis]|uniref:Maleylpyruvate isomerase family mycothiol-dependent enzyme n=1 Tax=Labedella gwakjiensis TaxID=390269 RepID=A0A2P8GUW4_9MICO|nr:maleylpyruvate isomerase family mycothiol-dependent enzyme [Labedella gwakjiensis]PSL37746.1 uncharacterized protein (TIGR03083 family) [Labedella gwakjiensis]RUQ87666.1 maleylpyruvate isomerase family mycothiol-dependent enzyme [Labedella gwakjiensis]
MKHTDYIESVSASSRAFAQVLATAPLDVAIRSCPGWTLADLTRHLGDVHRWARSKVTGAGAQEDEPAPDDPTDLIAWFEDGADALVTALRTRDADAPCWTLYPPAVVGTWARRQALETAIHLWDAAEAIGRPAEIPVALAVAGVGEVVGDLYPRQVGLDRIAPLRSFVEIRVLDAGGERVSFPLGAVDAPDGDRVTVELAAADALLLLWKRRTLDEVDVHVSGSESVLRSALRTALVP